MRRVRAFRLGVLWICLVCQLAATSCGTPKKDDDPKHEDKPERKDGKTPIPLIILNGLKLVLKLIRGRKSEIWIMQAAEHTAHATGKVLEEELAEWALGSAYSADNLLPK